MTKGPQLHPDNHGMTDHAFDTGARDIRRGNQNETQQDKQCGQVFCPDRRSPEYRGGDTGVAVTPYNKNETD